MVSLQVISKILATKDSSIIPLNNITVDYFVGYEEEIRFILEHEQKYGQVPDKATFLAKFPEIELVEVTESDRYLIDTIKEEYLYYKSVPIITEAAKLLKSNSYEASEYMVQQFQQLQSITNSTAVDIVAQAQSRYDKYLDRQSNQQNWFFTTGFPELDDLTHGIQREEELFVLFARTNQGKSWVLEKMCTHIWQLGFNVGYISPEMSADSIGYRFDTLYKNYSNKALMWGRGEVEQAEYENYIDTLKTANNKFLVATPLDFGRSITVTKLSSFIKANKLDVIAIDGITYLTDERYRRGDNKTTTLTNLAEDLMLLSTECHVPVLVVVQANREGKVEDDSDKTPDLETIRDSDGIAQNASKVISIRQMKDSVLQLGVKKQRFGPIGGKLLYQWNIDIGDFVYLPSYDNKPVHRPETVRKPVAKKDVF